MTDPVRQKHHLLQNMTVYASETPVFRERESAFRFHKESRRSIKKGTKTPLLQGKKSNNKSIVAKVDRSKQKAFPKIFVLMRG